MRKEYDDEDEIPERRHSSGKKKKKFGWVNVLTILLAVSYTHLTLPTILLV